jgi:hypothetical protein
MGIYMNGARRKQLHGPAVGRNNVAADTSYFIMNNSTPTLTQSGLLAVLLERQHYKAMRAARRSARFRRVRNAFHSAFHQTRSARQEAHALPKRFPQPRQLSAR